MTLEELIYQRFSTYEAFSEKLTTYAGRPAAFYQKAPDDRQEGWEKNNIHGPYIRLICRRIRKEKVPAQCRSICTVMNRKAFRKI